MHKKTITVLFIILFALPVIIFTESNNTLFKYSISLRSVSAEANYHNKHNLLFEQISSSPIKRSAASRIAEMIYSGEIYSTLKNADATPLPCYEAYFLDANRTKSLTLLENNMKKKIALAKQDDFKKIYYNYHNGILDVTSKYSSSQDIRVRISRNGPNDIYDITDVHLLANTNDYVTGIFRNATKLYGTAVTDWHSPFGVLAQNNADTDLPASFGFTGGYHGYSHAPSSAATAHHKSILCLADGKPLEGDSSGYCDNLSVMWANDVQASNTKRPDGNGRAVIHEAHTLNFDGTTWQSNVTLTPYEDVTFTRIYGFQAFINSAWNERVEYIANDSAVLMPFGSQHDSSIITNEVICRKGNNILKITIDPTVGIGNRVCVYDQPYAFTTPAGKVYFNLVNGAYLRLVKDEAISYSGTYSFYPLNR